MNQIIPVLLLVFFIWQCEPPANKEKNITTTTIQSTPAATAKTETYPSIPFELIKKLWDNCDYVDFVFYYSNFSMSQDAQNSIRGTIQHISKEPAAINPNCKAIGRVFFQIDGQNAAEADIHLAEGCAYYIFYKNGQKVYANKMTEVGLKFYQNIFAQQQGNQG